MPHSAPFTFPLSCGRSSRAHTPFLYVRALRRSPLRAAGSCRYKKRRDLQRQDVGLGTACGRRALHVPEKKVGKRRKATAKGEPDDHRCPPSRTSSQSAPACTPPRATVRRLRRPLLSFQRLASSCMVRYLRNRSVSLLASPDA